MRHTVWLLLLLSCPAFGDQPLAKRFFDAGNRLFLQGRFNDAALEYDHAYQAQPLPDFLYNTAVSYDKAGAREEALAAYQRYVALPQRDNREDAATQARMEVLKKELAMLAQSTPKHTPFPYIEAITRRPFPTYLSLGGRDYVLIGAGARTAFTGKIYGMGLYVEDEPARAAFPRLVGQAGGADVATLTHDELAYQFLQLGDFGKHAVLHFERPLTAARLRDSFREALADDLGPTATAELKRDAEAFLALFDRDLKLGDDLNLHTDTDGSIFVRVGPGFPRTGPVNQRLAHDVWSAWLGRKPMSPELKQHLVERIDALGR